MLYFPARLITIARGGPVSGQALKRGASPCTRPWRDLIVDDTGTFFLCPGQVALHHPIGRLGLTTPFAAFNSAAARSLRDPIERGAPPTMCLHCTQAEGRPFNALGPAQLSEHAGELGTLWQGADTHNTVASRDPALLPWGRYDYLSARIVAAALGHLALPGVLPHRYERVIGLTPHIAQHIVRVCRRHLGKALLAIFVCGSRVMTRQRQWLLDPRVFADSGAAGATLKRQERPRLRIYDASPRRSSDLDLKIFIRQGALPSSVCEELERCIAAETQAASPQMPLSGHAHPRLRLWPVPASIDNAREAFFHYNAQRPQLLGKSPHSPESVVCLHNGRSGDVMPDPVVTLAASFLVPAEKNKTPVDLARLRLPDDFEALSKSQKLRERHAGLSVHQLIGLLLDGPDREPGGIVIDAEGHVCQGAAAVWAAQQAGRPALHDLRTRRRRFSPAVPSEPGNKGL